MLTYVLWLKPISGFIKSVPNFLLYKIVSLCVTVFNVLISTLPATRLNKFEHFVK